jgi:hypothetical protein
MLHGLGLDARLHELPHHLAELLVLFAHDQWNVV